MHKCKAISGDFLPLQSHIPVDIREQILYMYIHTWEISMGNNTLLI